MRSFVSVTAPTAADAAAARAWPTWSAPAIPDPAGRFKESEWWADRPNVAEERCLVTAGRASLHLAGGDDGSCADDIIVIAAGDWVVFRVGFHCEWVVHERITKHYAYFDAAGDRLK
jgi:uncharacterized cupin superfamily protein